MNAIEQAVMPLKEEAIERAEQRAKEIISKSIARLEAAEWNLDRVAPRVKATQCSRSEYAEKMGKHSLYCSITRCSVSGRRPGEPNIRVKADDLEHRFVEQSKEMAALEYDAFVAKLVSKAGEAESAELKGNHVWGSSVLSVTKKGGAQEHWKTQMILNVSKLGKLFNQFPTRKVKNASA